MYSNRDIWSDRLQSQCNRRPIGHCGSNEGQSARSVTWNQLVEFQSGHDSAFRKTSGTLLGNIAIPNPQRIAFAPDGDLWAISGNSVVLISSVGTKNIVTTTLQGLVAPLALAVDPNTNVILVADGGAAQQVKRFSSGGRLLSTYGDPGGYTDCNPTVTKDRLFLDETAGTGYPGGAEATMGGIIFTATFLAVLPDSSFWVSDPGNARVLHISSQGQYIEQIAFLRFFYNVAADHGNRSEEHTSEL